MLIELSLTSREMLDYDTEKVDELIADFTP